MLKSSTILLGILIALVAVTPARATWSIIAIDPLSGEVGVAGASCFHDVDVIYSIVPGRGALVAQALTNKSGRDLARRHLAMGAHPGDVISALTRFRFDPLHATRQYAIVAFGHAPVSYSGTLTVPWSGVMHAQNVSVQGNLLRGSAVVRDTFNAFQSTAGEGGLPDRLITALEAGARAGGDWRCSKEQTALSAFMVASMPSDDFRRPAIRIIVSTQERGGKNPVHLLRQEYERGRTHQH